MGFSWSSCVAQAALMSICYEAGLSKHRVLAGDAPMPTDFSLVFAVATDDLMVFSADGEGPSVAAAREVEEVMLKRGIGTNT